MKYEKAISIFYYLVASGLVILTIGFVLWPGPGGSADNKVETADITRGAQQWANNCARCHNMREPTEFRDDEWKPIVYHMRVRAGLTGQQTRDILAFLQASNFTPSAATPIAEVTAAAVSELTGKEVYTQTCVACHGANGKGALPGVPDFTSKDGPLSKPDGLLLRHTIEGFQSPGSPMAMPPRGANPNLTDAELQEALIYIREEFGQ